MDLREGHNLRSRDSWYCAVIFVILMVVLYAAINVSTAQAEAATTDDQWKFSVTPYVWLPNVNGTLKYSIPPGASGSPNIETGPNNYLQNLQAVVMLSGDVRKDRWSLFTDIIYLSFGDQKSSVKDINFGGDLVSSSLNLQTTTSLRGTSWTLGAGYAVETGRAATLDLFGGLRYFDLTVSASWQLASDVIGPGGGQTFPRTGGISRSLTLWDGIVGVRGRVPLGSSDWSIPYYLDIGTGSSNVTYQWLLGVAWSFNQWGSVTFAYRDLYLDQKDDKFLQNLRFNGPALGATFRF